MSYESGNGFFQEETFQGQGVSLYRFIKNRIWYNTRSEQQKQEWLTLNIQAEKDALRLREEVTQAELDVDAILHAKIAHEKMMVLKRQNTCFIIPLYFMENEKETRQ
jgi:hypothetical protein